LKKNFFLGKSQNHKVFILEKAKLGVGVYFLGVIQIWDVWGHGRKKYSKLVTKIPIFTYSTSTRLRITQNLVEGSFLYILYNCEVKRALFGEARKNNPSSTFRELNRAFKIAMKPTMIGEGHFLT
jgi:hypothetical protein